MQKWKIKYGKIHKCILSIRIGAVGFLNWWLSIDQYFFVYWFVLLKHNASKCYLNWHVHTVHINIELKAESNKTISVLAQTQVHMASKAFWAGTAYPSAAPEFTPGF